jgi:hypothetical protein
MKSWLVLLLAFVVACGGFAANTPDVSGAPLDAAGLRLVVGVDRTRTLVVEPDGSVSSSDTGQTAMKFDGQELKSPDGSKTLLTLDGNVLRGPNQTTAGAFQGNNKVSVAGAWFSVRDDGVVVVEREGTEHKLRMHFDGSVKGRKRAALMLVTVIFALFVATHPTASLDRFYDD